MTSTSQAKPALRQRSRQMIFRARRKLPGMSETRFLHFSYHKCLTVLYGNVMRTAMVELLPGGYRHFQSRKDDFLRDVDHLKAASLNNHALDLDRFDFPLKATCFVRDPRDLVVSGYFYHRRGAEPWSTKVDPTPADWEIVNGVIPAGMQAGQSYADYLSGLEPEQGLLAELEFRTAHFDAMGAWNYDDPRLHLFRYEEILGKEEETFARFADIYDLNARWRRVILDAARQHSLSNVAGKLDHVRDPKPSQWREHFTPEVTRAFKDRYGDLLIKLGYESDLDW